MKKLYFLLIASIWGFTLLGQESITLQWQVTNEQNEPLVGVSVWKKQTSEGTTTDENGRFSMEVVPGKDELQVSYLGFESITIKTHEGMKSTGSEILFPTEYDLPEVTISAIYSEISRICCCYWVELRDPIFKSDIKTDSLFNFSYITPKVHVFPIPTSQTIFVQQETSLGQIDMYNLAGQKLQSFNFNDQLNASINLGAWPSGTYFLRSSKGWIEKVILQKQ
jgi:hypothetical protein